MRAYMPTTDLLDINVWLALADENHAHHQPARGYWDREAARQLAFTRVTMLGLLRLLTNKTVMAGNPFTVAEAWSAYQAFRALPEVMWIDEPNLVATQADEALGEWSKTSGFSSLHWTDGHLASLAHATGSRLVSFDNGFQRYRGLTFLHLPH